MPGRIPLIITGRIQYVKSRLLHSGTTVTHGLIPTAFFLPLDFFIRTGRK